MGDVFVYQPVLVGGVFGHVMRLDQSRVSKYIWWIIIINVITIIIIITIIITTDKGGSYHKVYLPSDHLYQNFIKWDDLLLREVFNYNFF